MFKVMLNKLVLNIRFNEYCNARMKTVCVMFVHCVGEEFERLNRCKSSVCYKYNIRVIFVKCILMLIGSVSPSINVLVYNF